MLHGVAKIMSIFNNVPRDMLSTLARLMFADANISLATEACVHILSSDTSVVSRCPGATKSPHREAYLVIICMCLGVQENQV